MFLILRLFFLAFFSLQATEQPIFLPYLSKIEQDLLPSNLEKIDRLFVINLEKRKDRLEQIKEIFLPYQVGLNRVNAVNGKNLTDEEMSLLIGHKKARLRKSEMGCLLSHLSVLWHSYQMGYQTVWIVEDDVEIKEDLKTISAHIKALEKLDPEWDIFYTDPDFSNRDNEKLKNSGRRAREDQGLYPRRFFSRRKVCNQFWKINRRWGTHSLVVSKRGVEKIIKYYLAHSIWTAIDIDMHFIPNMHQYTPLLPLVTNRPESDSDTSR